MPHDFSGLRCPRCGASLLVKNGWVWCSFVGNGRNERPCTFGVDAPVSRSWLMVWQALRRAEGE